MKGGIHLPKVTVKKGETIDRSLRRLKKKIDKEGIMKAIKQHRFFEKPSEKRRRKVKEALKKRDKSPF